MATAVKTTVVKDMVNMVTVTKKDMKATVKDKGTKDMVMAVMENMKDTAMDNHTATIMKDMGSVVPKITRMASTAGRPAEVETGVMVEASPTEVHSRKFLREKESEKAREIFLSLVKIVVTTLPPPHFYMSMKNQPPFSQKIKINKFAVGKNNRNISSGKHCRHHMLQNCEIIAQTFMKNRVSVCVCV